MAARVERPARAELPEGAVQADRVAAAVRAPEMAAPADQAAARRTSSASATDSAQ